MTIIQIQQIVRNTYHVPGIVLSAEVKIVLGLLNRHSVVDGVCNRGPIVLQLYLLCILQLIDSAMYHFSEGLLSHVFFHAPFFHLSISTHRYRPPLIFFLAQIPLVFYILFLRDWKL